MEPIIITTPSGHVVTLKTKLSFGDKRRLQRVWAGAMKTNAAVKTDADITFDGSAIYDAQDLAVKLMVQQIALKDGATIEGGDKCLATIFAWTDDRDGQAVYDKINELTKDTITPEKKGS